MDYLRCKHVKFFTEDFDEILILIVLDSLGWRDCRTQENGEAGATRWIISRRPCRTSIYPVCEAGAWGNRWRITKEVEKKSSPVGAFGRLAEMSNGKDTITGHWEIAGLYTEIPFKTFPVFPLEFMAAYEKAIGMETLGNYAASGTEIIEALGPEHEKTGKPIIYTSADSVFQIAANTAVIPLEKLYQICEVAREMLIGDVQVGRVIARPYVIEGGKRIRTADRKDYAVSPSGKTVLDHVKDAGKTVYAIGKISIFFYGRASTCSVLTERIGGCR